MLEFASYFLILIISLIINTHTRVLKLATRRPQYACIHVWHTFLDWHFIINLIMLLCYLFKGLLKTNFLFFHWVSHLWWESFLVTLGSTNICMIVMTILNALLSFNIQGQSVVVDDENTSRKTRKSYLTILKNKVHCNILYFCYMYVRAVKLSIFPLIHLYVNLFQFRFRSVASE